MKNISPFQIGIYVACVIGIFGAVLLFSGKIPIGNKNTNTALVGAVTIWGTFPLEDIDPSIDIVRKIHRDVTVTYVQKSPAQFQTDLVNALASGVGPDLITVSLADVIPNKDRLLTIPFASLPETLFRATFVDQAEHYINDAGVVAFPFSVDPLVMFYNKDLLTSSFVVQPPVTWDDVATLNEKVTQKDDAGTLITETVALGTFDNITHAKDLIAMMIFQAGNGLVRFDPSQKKYVSTFGLAQNGASPVALALGFYTSFANLDNERYSWNRTLPNDQDQFIAGKLAIYFGYASEITKIRERNPNLNFSLAMMPQRTNSPSKITYGNMMGFAITKISKNPTVALAVAQIMVGRDSVQKYLSGNPFMAPARKDMLAELPQDPVSSLVYKSAIISRGFLDPDPGQTTGFFRRYIDQINSGLIESNAIVAPGNSLLNSILSSVQR